MPDREPNPFTLRDFTAAMGYDVVPPLLDQRRKRVCLSLDITLDEFDQIQTILAGLLPRVPAPDEVLRPAHYYDDLLARTLGQAERFKPDLPPGETPETLAQRTVDYERRGREMTAAFLRADRALRDEAIAIMEQILANMGRKLQDGEE